MLIQKKSITIKYEIFGESNEIAKFINFVIQK